MRLAALPLIFALFAPPVLAQEDAPPDVPAVVTAPDAGVTVGDAFKAPVGPAIPDPNADVIEFLKVAYEAGKAGEWGKLIFLIVTFLVWVTRRFLAPRVPFLASSLSLMVQTLLWAFAGALATTWVAGTGLTWGMVVEAGRIAIEAVGAWEFLKNILNSLAANFSWAKAVMDFLSPPAPTPAGS